MGVFENTAFFSQNMQHIKLGLSAEKDTHSGKYKLLDKYKLIKFKFSQTYKL